MVYKKEELVYFRGYTGDQVCVYRNSWCRCSRLTVGNVARVNRWWLVGSGVSTGIAGQSGVVDMTETTPGVPLRSPLSDIASFSTYHTPSLFYRACTGRSFSRFPSSTFVSLPHDTTGIYGMLLDNI